MPTTLDIQRALAARGFDPGPIDGDMGPKTRHAIKEFQAKNGLAVDGILGPMTLGALAAHGAVTLPNPNPSPPGGRVIHTLVWHCTATKEGQEFTVAQIDVMHRARGFDGIGYHRLYHLDGRVSQGRPESRPGAHVTGHNAHTLGFSYVGGLDKAGKPKDTRTEAQHASMLRDTIETVRRLKLRAVVGHRDLSPDLDGDGIVEPFEWIKVCPCFDAVADYGRYVLAGAA